MAKLWIKVKDKCQCQLCSHFCLLSKENPLGKCKVRYFSKGEVHSLVDMHLACLQVDPIEKKPLYHFKPKSQILSVGTVGCNFTCKWCQNHTLVNAINIDEQYLDEFDTLKQLTGKKYSIDFLLEIAKREKAQSIAYTYNEPTIFYEQFEQIAIKAQEKELYNVLVSNGYFSATVFANLKNYIHAMNIDLKSFSEKTYQIYCNARLKPVLDSLIRIKESGIHLEVTTLFIPEINDSLQEMKNLVSFLVKYLGKDTIWHISTFYPAYQLQEKQKTPLSTLDNAYQIGKELGLEYIYYGNVAKDSITYCPKCHKELIKRKIYHVEIINNFNGICPKCGEHIIGIW